MRLSRASLILLIILFIFSRIFIFFNPPLNYSDVRVDYERYAHMWRQGHWPYLKHNYEYPPASVPILYFPLFLYHAGIGDYYKNYRAQTLVFDVAFFIFLTATINYRFHWSKSKKFTSLYLYIFLSTFTRAFLYEGIDLIFTATIMAAYLLPLWFSPKSSWSKYLKWLSFWLSTSVKFLTLPLILPIFLLSIFTQVKTPHSQTTKNINHQLRSLLKNSQFLDNFKQEFFALIVGFILIWGPPILVFRQKLLISFTYNFARPIKYASFPAYIIKTVNYFTHSEKQHGVPPDFEWQGPVADQITQINRYTFPLIMAAYLLWTIRIILQTYLNQSSTMLDQQKQCLLLLKIHVVYLFTLFLSAKTFSQPFHIWYLPALALLAVHSKKQQWLTVACVSLMMLLDLTEIFHFTGKDTWGYYLITVIKDGLRFVPMLILLIKTSQLKIENMNSITDAT